ncbi:hypothetical protein LF296_13135 [Acinetobacter vivianii]|uniref:Uncharacterized protein n=1 Tax=Acinetobacter vivianii TaxID=1776742 RepID=A0AAJ6NH48_9GAMM|nr:hypothetical protein [Acinetobacter vivianii]WDZ50265.1 hypothetical protein LF296_13135 [Acinetobacter vivianii]
MKKFIFCLIFLSSPVMAAQTTWYAGSSYKGTVTVPIENGPNVVWKCNGKVCTMSGPWGNALSLDSCQNLVLRVGKISYYKNSAGAIWNAKSSELTQCNQVAR